MEVWAGDGAAAAGGLAGAVAGVVVSGAWAGGLPRAIAWLAGLPGPDVPARETWFTLSPASQQLRSQRSRINPEP